MYHWPTTTINNVRTSGKAGYRVWKSAGGQGDHDMSLLFDSFLEIICFELSVSEVFVANPLPIVQTKIQY